MNDIALVINTVHKNHDLWEMFFGQLDKFLDMSITRYVFVDEADQGLPKDISVILYDETKTYKEQFASCIGEVKEKYCIYISEDYILYDQVQRDRILHYKKVLDEEKDLSFIRFMKGGVVELKFLQYQTHQNLYQLYNFLPYFYTNQVALWRTRDLEKIHQLGPNLHIGNVDYENSFEFQATKTCEELGIQGVFCYHGEPKRGLYHYDCEVFPHISTALVKGKWNLAEYPNELSPLLEEYSINIDDRGVFNVNT